VPSSPTPFPLIRVNNLRDYLSSHDCPLTKKPDLNHMAPLSHDLLPLYREDTASFHALLAFAALLSSIEHGNVQSLQLSQLEGQAIATIQGRIEHCLSSQVNGTLMAVAIMAHLEVSFPISIEAERSL
jgi:hypothetical protein